MSAHKVGCVSPKDVKLPDIISWTSEATAGITIKFEICHGVCKRIAAHAKTIEKFLIDNVAKDRGFRLF